MKKILFIVSILFCLVSKSQVYQRYPQYGGDWNRIYASLGLSIPGDTSAIPTDHKTFPAIAGKGDSLYLWSWRQQRYILITGAGAGDTSVLVTQFDVSKTTFGHTFFDTLFTDKMIDGTANTRDNAFPSVIQMPNGKLLLGYYKGFNHSTEGIPMYVILDSAGLGVVNPVALESSFARNWESAVPSRGRGDTVLISWSDAQHGHILRKYSVNSAVSWSAVDSINATLPDRYLLLSQTGVFKGLNITPIYKVSPSTPQSGVLVSPNILATTWDTIWFTNSVALQLNESSDPVIDGDTCKLFLRSELDNLDTMYMVWSINGRTWSTPIPVRVPGWMAGKPDVKKALDGTYIMDHRIFHSPALGQIAISYNKGNTWDSLYGQNQGFFSYGSSLQLGFDRWVNFCGSILAGPGYGDIYRNYYNISSRGVDNLGTILNENGAPQIIENELLQRRIAAAGSIIVSDYVHTSNVNETAAGKKTWSDTATFSKHVVVNSGGLAIEQDVTSTGLTVRGLGTNNAGGATGFLTTLGRDRLFTYDYGAANDYQPFNIYNSNSIFQNGTVQINGLTASKLVSTSGSKVLQSTTIGYGLTGLGTLAVDTTLILSKTVGTNITGAMQVTSLFTAKAGINLTGTTSPLQLNSSAGTSGQVLISGGAGTTPSWISQSSIVGANIYNTNGSLTSNRSLSINSKNIDFTDGFVNSYSYNSVDQTTTIGGANAFLLTDDNDNEVIIGGNHKVKIQDASLGAASAGYLWALVNGTGEGHWIAQSSIVGATPTLQQVTDVGVTTTNNITTNGLLINGNALISAATSTGVNDYTAGQYRISSWGANAGTAGIIRFQSLSSDGSITRVPMVLHSNGNVGISNTAPGELLSLGSAGSTKGVISLAGNTSGKAVIQPAAAAGTPIFTLGTTTGTIAGTLTNTATLDFGSTVAGAVSDLTISVTGAVDGDAVSIGVPNGSMTATATYTAWVSAADTVTIRFSPKATEDPASGTFRASVIKY